MLNGLPGIGSACQANGANLIDRIGVLKGGQITGWLVEIRCTNDPAHDLCVACLWKIADKYNRLRPQRLSKPGRHQCSELLAKVLKVFAQDGLETTASMLHKELAFATKRKVLAEDIHLLCFQILNI